MSAYEKETEIGCGVLIGEGLPIRRQLGFLPGEGGVGLALEVALCLATLVFFRQHYCNVPVDCSGGTGPVWQGTSML